MKNSHFTLVLISLLAHFTTKGQEIPIPDNFSIVASTKGDLDQDGEEELAVAYNTDKIKASSREGSDRVLHLYKRNNQQWQLWQESKQALLGSEDGGMMGDPFGELLIIDGILIISHNGGSSWKWDYTDKYRYKQGVFYLIGYSSSDGKNCEYWSDFDFNLVTGKIIIKHEYEKCDDEYNDNITIYKRENETFYKKGIVITLQERTSREVKIVSPKYKHDFYVSN